jgi:hypothetical protein
MSRLLITLLTLAFVSPAFAAGPTWQAGFGKAAITPDNTMRMSGYASRTKPAEGKETDLWAKAAVLQDAKGNKLVLVTLDLVGIDRGLSEAVCKLIEDKLHVPREAVILSVSHTHCGPVAGTTLRAMYFLDDEQAKLVHDYTEQLPGKVLRAVDAAAKSLAPVTLKSGVGTAGFAVNRRENKENDVPDLRAGGRLKGPSDHDVPVLAAYGTDGKLRGVIFGYACHATVLSFQKWCGDYPGFAMMGLEKAQPGAVAMFFAGCGADQNPLPRRTVELAKDYGRQLAAAVGEVLRGKMTTLAPESAAAYKEIALPLAEVPTREALARTTLSANKYEAARAKMLLKKLQTEGSIPGAYPTYPVQAWRLGKDLTLLALGGEVVVDYSRRLKKELGANTWVMGYANDVMAYIPSARVLKEGGYEGATSMIYYGLPSVWGPRVEELIVAAAHQEAKAVRGK